MMKKAFIEMIDDEKIQRLTARGDARSLEEAVNLAIKYEGTESGQDTKTPKEKPLLTTVARQMDGDCDTHLREKPTGRDRGPETASTKVTA